MYDFVDRPVTALDDGGRFLIWCMRSWVRSMSVGRCPCAVIGPAFGKRKMTAGLPHFHMMMMALNHDGLEELVFAQPDCNRVSEDEALILGTLVLRGDSHPTAMRDMAALLVSESSIVTLLTAMTALGRAMAESRIFPERPHYDPARGCARS